MLELPNFVPMTLSTVKLKSLDIFVTSWTEIMTS